MRAAGASPRCWHGVCGALLRRVRRRHLATLAGLAAASLLLTLYAVDGGLPETLRLLGSRREPPAPSPEEERADGLLTVPLERLVEANLPSHGWFQDRDCVQYETRFARPGSLPDARLASFFRSGNTWTRYLLEAATGLFTCGPTNDTEASQRAPTAAIPSVGALRRLVLQTEADGWTSPELRRAGFAAEQLSPAARACLLAKTHAFAPQWRRRDGGEAAGYPLPAVLLVRDPFRALISLRHFHARSSVNISVSRAQRAAFAGADWEQFVATYGQNWFDLPDDWATSPRHTLLVAYERLVADPGGELRRMLRFLGIRPEAGRLECALRHVQGPFHNREHEVVPDSSVFSRSQTAFLWSRILDLNERLTSRGYRRLPVEKYAFFYDVWND